MENKTFHRPPYNPQGQAIFERANQTLKRMLQKQKGGDANAHS